MLDRIRNELEKRKANNQGLIKIVRDSLNEYESKLNDLHESLREAKEQTKLAENLNGENKRLLEEIKVNLSTCLPTYLSGLMVFMHVALNRENSIIWRKFGKNYCKC